MADNYLEKKMEEFRSGKVAVRRPSVSLETLLQSAGGKASGGDTLPETDQAEKSVMPAQIDAVVRAANILKESESFQFDIDEKAGIIRLLGPTSPRRYLLEAGEVIMAMRLKAAELHLHCSIEIRPESTTPANPLIATFKLYK